MGAAVPSELQLDPYGATGNVITNQMEVIDDPSIIYICDIETAWKKAGVTAIPVKPKGFMRGN